MCFFGGALEKGVVVVTLVYLRVGFVGFFGGDVGDGYGGERIREKLQMIFRGLNIEQCTRQG